LHIFQQPSLIAARFDAAIPGAIIETNRARTILSLNVRKKRKTLRISQEKLAEMVGVSTQTVNDIECGRSWVSDRTVSKLAEVLGVDVFQLFVPEDASGENPETLSAALMQLRQDIKADLGSYIETHVNERFSKFLNSELFYNFPK
jgi:transcriptional regulator with XRE-family HTH domain